MSEDTEVSPRRTTHAIGESLDTLSTAELDERIALLRLEVERLETAGRLKKTARDEAGSIFKT